MKLINIFGILMIFGLLFSCENDNSLNNDKSANSIDLSSNWGGTKSIDVMGTVYNESGNPISGAMVELGQNQTQTDENGVFMFKDANAYEKFAYVKVTKSGYLEGSRSFVPSSEGYNIVKIQLLDAIVTTTISSGTASTVSTPEGVSIEFPGDFIQSDGTTYSGNVDVMIHYLDPTEEIDDQMPGALYAANTQNEERFLETFGMVSVELRGSSGQELNLAPNMPATISMPLDASLVNEAPSTIPLWYFDEEKGYWIEEGSAELQGNRYVGEVNHFSWWNCDVPYPLVLLTIHVTNDNGESLPFTKVGINLNNSSSNPRISYTNSNGLATGWVPANELLGVYLGVYLCTDLAPITTIGPFSSDANQIVTFNQTETVIGNFVDCSGNPVSQGYVTLVIQNKTFNFPLTNGSFNFSFLNCPISGDTFTLEGIDYNTQQSTGILNYVLTTPVTQIGTIQACNAVTEFISYSIDNSGTQYALSNINCGLGPNGVVEIDGLTLNGYGLYFAINGVDIGLYNHSTAIQEFWFEGEFYPNYDLPPYNFDLYLNSWGPVGTYVDITFSGTYFGYEDPIPQQHTVVGTMHVLRDN